MCLCGELASGSELLQVVNGEFQEKKISELLLAPAHVERGPDESPIYGTRNLKDNISDLKAQVNAGRR